MSTLAKLSDVQSIVPTNLFLIHNNNYYPVVLQDLMGFLQIGVMNGTEFVLSQKHTTVFNTLQDAYRYIAGLKNRKILVTADGVKAQTGKTPS